MSTPYAPPTSRFDDAPIGLRALRLQAAMIFAALPMLLLVGLQVDLLFFEANQGSTVLTWSPALFLLPLIGMAMVSGAACAARLAVASLPATLLFAVVFASLWAVPITYITYYVLELHGVFREPSWNDVAGVMWRLELVMLPLALVGCVWARRHGRVNGFAASRP